MALEKVIDDSAKNKSPILLEGFSNYGEPIPCEQTLNKLLSEPNHDQIVSESAHSNDEVTKIVRYGFIHNLPLIPADKQNIDSNDINNFYQNKTEKLNKLKKNFEFMHLLHGYYGELKNIENNKDGKTLDSNEILQKVIKNENGKNFKTVESFKSEYKKLNGNDFPVVKVLDQKEKFYDELKKVNDQIYQDFTPSAFLNPKMVKGTNKLTDEQDLLRNKTLIRAIQITKENFGKATAYYGSGHLAVIGPILEKKLGKPSKDPLKTDFVNACKESKN